MSSDPYRGLIPGDDRSGGGRPRPSATPDEPPPRDPALYPPLPRPNTPPSGPYGGGPYGGPPAPPPSPGSFGGPGVPPPPGPYGGPGVQAPYPPGPYPQAPIPGQPFRPLPESSGGPPWGRIALVAGGALVVLLAVLVIIAPDTLDTNDRSMVAVACTGTPVAGAAGYTGGTTGVVSYAKPDGSTPFSYQRNSTTGLKPPATVAEVQAVLCLDAPVQEIIDICAYGDEGDDIEDVTVLESISISRTARLVDPATGQTLASNSITNQGDDCPSMVFENATESRLWASEPDLDSFEAWVLQELG